MAAPNVPSIETWYYASDLTAMLQALRDEGKRVLPDADLRNNELRVKELKKHLNPIPTLDEARARFGDGIRGRNVPVTREAFNLLTNVQDENANGSRGGSQSRGGRRILGLQNRRSGAAGEDAGADVAVPEGDRGEEKG